MITTKRYAPVGRCIYCGATSEETELTDEHIIPYGLNGDLLLPESSCRDCSRETGAVVEQDVLRKMLIDLRTHEEFRTRKKKARPTSLRVGRFNPDQSFDRYEYLDISLHPYAACLPIFELPTQLTDRPHSDGFMVTGVSTVLKPEFIPRLNALGKGAAYVQDFHPGNFGRMLAKIAHSYTVAELGYGSFVPFLQKVILGRAPSISRYVGGVNAPAFPASKLHHLQVVRRDGYINVLIRLFADKQGGPTYLVVTGAQNALTRI